MRILLANYDLNNRGGTQMFVRDTAVKLLEWGHEPIVYGPTLGAIAADLSERTIPVTSDLRTIGDAPDVIAGNHHLETMTALQQFPRTPAVFVCHAWLTVVPRHPRIRRYVAVDETCRTYLLDQCGIPSSQIEVVLNGIDMARFAPRPPLPPRPKRAALFGNQFVEDQTVDAVRRACGEAGIELDVISRGTGTTHAAPEEVLGGYDLVFARARCAIEAMAVGAAVVLTGPGRMSTLVTSHDFDELRRLNFGRRLLTTPIDAAAVRREIERYDPIDAAVVSRRIRETASLDLAVARLLRIAEEVITEQIEQPADIDAESAAMADYLREIDRQIRLASIIGRLRQRIARWPLIGGLLSRVATRLLR